MWLHLFLSIVCDHSRLLFFSSDFFLRLLGVKRLTYHMGAKSLRVISDSKYKAGHVPKHSQFGSSFVSVDKVTKDMSHTTCLLYLGKRLLNSKIINKLNTGGKVNIKLVPYLPHVVVSNSLFFLKGKWSLYR